MIDPIDPNGIVSTPTETTEPVPAIKWGWLRALLFLPAWFVGVIVAGVIAFFAFGVTSSEEMQAQITTSSGIVIQGLQLLLTLIPVYLFRRFIDRRSFCSIGFQFNRPFRRDLLVGMAMGIGLIGLVFVILLASGGIVLTDIQLPGSAFAAAVVVMMMVGIGEELVMRGYVQGNLMASMNKYVALLLVSILFAGSHMFNPNASLLGLVNIILAGLLLGIYYVHKQNLWLPIGMHFTWNLFQGSVFGSQVSGVSTESIFNFEITGSDLLTGGSFGFEASIVTTGLIIAAIIALHLVYRPRTT